MKSNKFIKKGIPVLLFVAIITLAVFPSDSSEPKEKTTTLTFEKSMNALYLDITHRQYDEIKINSNEKTFLLYMFNIRVAGTSGGRFNLWALPVEYSDSGTSVDLELGDLPDGCVMGSNYILIDSRGGGEDRDLQFAVVVMLKAGDEKWTVVNPKVSIENLWLSLGNRLSYWNSPPIRLTVEEQRLSEAQISEWVDGLPKQVKIGIVLPGGWHWGDQILRFAEDDINQYCVTEGVNYDFEFIVVNAEGSAEQHLWEVQHFDGLGLNLLIGGYWSSHAQQSLDYVNSRDMLLISPSSTAPELAIPGDNLFRLSPSTEEETHVITRMLETQGIEAVLVLHVEDMYAWSSAESIIAALDENPDCDLLDVVSYDRELEHLDEQMGVANGIVDGAASPGYDVAIVYLGFDEAVEVVQRVPDYSALHEAMWFSWESTVLNHWLIEAVPEIAAQLKLFSPLARPNRTKFDELATRYTDETGRNLNQYDFFYVANEYDSCWLYAKAIIAAETFETEPVKTVLPEIAETHDGVSGPIYLNENGDRRLVDCDILGCGYVNGDVEWIPYGEYLAETDEVTWFFPLYDDFEDGDFTANPTWLIDYTHSSDPNGINTEDMSPPTLMMDHTYYFEGRTSPSPLTGWLYTNNPTNVGSWQFDSRISSADDGYNTLILGDDHTFWNGSLYTVFHDWNGGNPRIRFLKEVPFWTCPTWATLIDAGDGYELDRWYTIKITRDIGGNWELFVDGESKGTAYDVTYTQLDWLGIGRYGGFDNVVVTPP